MGTRHVAALVEQLYYQDLPLVRMLGQRRRRGGGPGHQRPRAVRYLPRLLPVPTDMKVDWTDERFGPEESR